MVEHTFTSERSYSSIILALMILQSGKCRIVLVYEPTKPLPICWKFPGGRKALGETSEETALRELEEETGFTLGPNDQLSLLCKENMGNHERYLYLALTTEGKTLKEIGEEGEIVGTFEFSEFEEMVDFLPSHRALLACPGVKENLQNALEEFLNK